MSAASRYVQSALQSALYSADVVDAFIVDPTGVVIASSEPAQVGSTVARRPQLNELIAMNRVARLRRFTPATSISSGRSRCRSATRRSARFASA